MTIVRDKLSNARCTFVSCVVLAAHLQRAPTSGAVLPSGSASWLLNGVSGLSQSLQVTQQKLRLHSLQMERERLKQRQQEIIRQVSRSREYVINNAVTNIQADGEQPVRLRETSQFRVISCWITCWIL